MKSQLKAEAQSQWGEGREFDARSRVCGEVGAFSVWQAAIRQERLKKGVVTKPAPQEQAPAEAPEVPKHKTGADLKAELDDLLDEIDGVLEENAEEFVRSYIQKGGE